jgi:hypothetical protein
MRVVSQIACCPDTMGTRRQEQQLALRVFAFHFAAMMLRRQHALGKVIGARKVGVPLCHCE